MLIAPLRFLLVFSCSTLLMCVSLWAQSGFDLRPPSVGFATGGLSYKDISGSSISAFNNSRPGYSMHIEAQFSNSFSLAGFFMWGTLAGTGTSQDAHLSFESKINAGGLNLNYHFANGYLLKQTSLIDPYIGIGIGYMNYETFADIKDKAGNTYFYWSDGSIRSKDEHDELAYSALVIKKDKVAETALPLMANGKKYPSGTLIFPLNIGFLFTISPSFQFQGGAAFNLTLSDWLDNMSSAGMGVSAGTLPKSQFLFTSIGLNYNFGKNEKKESKADAYAKVNFKDIEKSDEDKDGVLDAKDKCPGTPAQVKVDASGCALDDDKDGVTNELDKEPGTKPGLAVNEQGVAMAKSKIKAATPEIKEASERMKPVEISKTGRIVTSTMPAEYRWADTDGDGKISQAEISGSIDVFFDGADPAINREKIMKLIDFFFDQ